jgi:hypothetical protein
MARVRNEHGRKGARDSLSTVYPVPDEVEFRRLRELAIGDTQEAKRLKAGDSGHLVKSGELISAALDAVARDYFKRALLRAVSRWVR